VGGVAWLGRMTVATDARLRGDVGMQGGEEGEREEVEHWLPRHEEDRLAWERVVRWVRPLAEDRFRARPPVSRSLSGVFRWLALWLRG
jgi:hypothetical protein